MFKKIALGFLLSFLLIKSMDAALVPGEKSLANSMAAGRAKTNMLSAGGGSSSLSENTVQSASGSRRLSDVSDKIEQPKPAILLNQTPNNKSPISSNSLAHGSAAVNNLNLDHKSAELGLIDIIPSVVDNRPLALILASDERFTPFLDLVKTKASSLFQAIQKASVSAPLTLFVPTKDVFNKISLLKPEILALASDPKAAEVVQQLLKLHAAHGEFLSLASRALSIDPVASTAVSAKSLNPIKTVGAIKLPFNFGGNKFSLGTSEIVSVIKGQNGTIFLIDNLLTDPVLGNLHLLQKDFLKTEVENKLKRLQKTAKTLNK
jgi:uncharacterized surface protein with fasciclin (FAS1) repeats